MHGTRITVGAGAAATALALLSACVYAPTDEQLAARAAPGIIALDPDAPRLEAIDARHFELAAGDDELLGEMQVLFARYENTFPLIAREHNLGYEELRQANPGVDVWLPGEGTPVYLPTLSVMPDAPREGIVLNLPSMRLLYFEPRSVTSHPVGIGREGWATPIGSAEVTDKARDPTWYPPASVRAEHAALGDPLPGIVPPGPDNPLGRHAIALSMPGYLIHGTNKPAGVGMRVSHGCIRLYPEDIEALFERVPRGTPVHIVDQPVLAGWRGDRLYLEVHAPLAEDERDLAAEAERVILAALERRAGEALAPAEAAATRGADTAADATGGADTAADANRHAETATRIAVSSGADLTARNVGVEVDWDAVARVVAEQRGIPFPVLAEGPTLEAFLASARIIDNQVRPLQAWQSTP